MKIHLITDFDQSRPGRCSFGLTEVVLPAAVSFFAADAAVDVGAAALGETAAAAGAAGAADLGAGALGLGEAAAAGGVGGAEAAGLGATELGAAGLGTAGVAGLGDLGAFAGLDLGSLGGLGGAGGALDAAGAAAPTALEAAAPAASSALPAAGAVTSPLGALESGAGAVLDTAAGTSSLGSGALSFAPDFQAVGDAISAGIFDPVGANATAFAPSAEMTAPAFSSQVADALPGLNAANEAIDTAGAGFTSPDIASAAGTALDTGTGSAAGSAAGGGAGGGTAGGGGGLGSTFGSVMSGLKTVAPLVPLASLGATLIRGEPGLPQSEQQVQGAAGNMLATGQQNLTMAANQQITAPQAQQIDTWRQQQLNQLYQLYARAGRDPKTDTDYLQGVQQIENQAVAMKQQFIDQLIQTGLGETGQATSALQGAAQMQIQQDRDFQQAVSSAVGSFGLTAGLSGLNINLSKATT